MTNPLCNVCFQGPEQERDLHITERQFQQPLGAPTTVSGNLITPL